MSKPNSKKLIQFHIPPSLQVSINEMATHYGMTVAALVRFSLSRLYNGEFRKERYGYQAGTETSRRRIVKDDKKQSTEEKIVAIQAMTNEQLTAYLYEIGYSEDYEINTTTKEIAKFKVMEHEESGQRMYVQYSEYPDGSEGANFATLWTIPELMGELKKAKKI